MPTLTAVGDLPRTPAVYAMYGGTGRGLYVAYVGVADNLRNRIAQHLLRRDSSVTTGTSAVALNPDYVTLLRWWEHLRFNERASLEASELVAFTILEPALRSRGAIRHESRELSQDPVFLEEMQQLFAGEPAGTLSIRTLDEAFQRIDELEQRLALLEQTLRNGN
jgi:hypothetical protein